MSEDLVEKGIQITMPLTEAAEGMVLHPYLCPAGVPTIGLGSTHYENGVAVTLRDPPITPQRARELLRWKLRYEYGPAIAKLAPGADLARRLAALIDFGYNLGITAFKTSTLRRYVNAQDWPGSVVQVMRWTKSRGRVLPGLVKRCKMRAELLK